MQQFILDRAVSKACMHLRNCFGGNHLYFVLYKGDKISEGIFIVTSKRESKIIHILAIHFILEFTTEMKTLSEILLPLTHITHNNDILSTLQCKTFFFKLF